jgi:hypothetical protein
LHLHPSPPCEQKRNKKKCFFPLFAEFFAEREPFVQAALDALSYGAKAVRIIDGTDPDSFALALAGTGGTLVVA